MLQSTFINLTTAGQAELVCIIQTTFNICIKQSLFIGETFSRWPVSMFASDVLCKWSWQTNVHWKTYVALSNCKKKGGEENMWHAALVALWKWLASGPQYLLSDLQLSSKKKKKSPSMKLTKITLSRFAHFYIYASANIAKPVNFDGLPLKQVSYINNIVQSCESKLHVWRYSCWWWFECFAINLSQYLSWSITFTDTRS